jgi:hypothetical protein
VKQKWSGFRTKSSICVRRDDNKIRGLQIDSVSLFLYSAFIADLCAGMASLVGNWKPFPAQENEDLMNNTFIQKVASTLQSLMIQYAYQC